MAKSKKTVPKPYESTRASDSFVRIYGDMIASDAWQELSSGQRDLYSCMKLANAHLTRTERALIKSLPDSLTDIRTGDSVRINKDSLFFFNRYRWHKPKKDSLESMTSPKMNYEFRLYSNQSQFYRDRDKLVKCGFIRQLLYEKPDGTLRDEEDDETDRGNKPKSLYLLSTEWKYLNPKKEL